MQRSQWAVRGMMPNAIALYQKELLPLKPVFGNTKKSGKAVGRPRSVYTGQLHFKVLEEDQIWFKETARSYEVQQGRFFNHLRKLFETHG